jgi:hypothetical protein
VVPTAPLSRRFEGVLSERKVDPWATQKGYRLN